MSEAEEKIVVVVKKNVTKSSSFVQGNQVGFGILILVGKTIREVLLIWGQQPAVVSKSRGHGGQTTLGFGQHLTD